MDKVIKQPRRGEKSLQDRKPTIIDVAKTARVGVMTVSRVINDYDTVRPKTRARVLSAIAKVGYKPNEAARMLKGMRGKTIAFIVPDLSDFFASCFHAIQEVAMRHDYQTLVVATGRNAMVENQQIEAIHGPRLAGLLVVTSGNDATRIGALRVAGIPVVALDRPLPGIDADVVLVENREGAERGVEHLIQHKHKRIACVGFDRQTYTVRQRVEGYQKALRAAKLPAMVFDRVNTMDAMTELINRWFSMKNRPTAVFSLQRISSIRLVQALHKRGVQVPRDIAVVGFDDFELAEVLGTPLTVVAQSPTEIGRRAAELLFRQIRSRQASEPIEDPAKVLLSTKLIIRTSCGCNPHA